MHKSQFDERAEDGNAIKNCSYRVVYNHLLEGQRCTKFRGGLTKTTFFEGFECDKVPK